MTSGAWNLPSASDSYVAGHVVYHRGADTDDLHHIKLGVICRALQLAALCASQASFVYLAISGGDVIAPAGMSSRDMGALLGVLVLGVLVGPTTTLSHPVYEGVHKCVVWNSRSDRVRSGERSLEQ